MTAAIVFDLDGTLIDSAPDMCAVANRVLAGEGAGAVTLEETRGFIGNGASVFVAKMRAARGIPDAEHDRLLGAFVTAYETAVDLTRPYPGVRDALEALGGAGFALGICTNKPIRAARAVLAHLDLARYFGSVIGGDSLAVRKPDPATLLAAFDGLGDPGGPGAAGRRLYIGDSEVDAETAQRAGAPFLLYTRGYRKGPIDAIPCARRFDDFDALAHLVRDMLER